MLLEGFATSEPLEDGMSATGKKPEARRSRRSNPTRVRFAPSEAALRRGRGIRERASDASERVVMAEAYIVAAARTAGGRRGGRLAGWNPVDLAARVLDALVQRAKADP